MYGENCENLLRFNAGSLVHAVGPVFSVCYISRNEAPVYGPVILVGILQNLVAEAYCACFEF